MNPYYSGHPDQKFGNITYSQNGEDLVILNLFDQLGIAKPSYLDLGAHHPSRISNTKLMYERGSRGVNVEANPFLIEQFKRDRPLDKNVNMGVNRFPSGISREQMYMYDDWSGRNTFSLEEYEKCVQQFGMKMEKSFSIDCMSVNDIVQKWCYGEWPDFLSCDVEGMDYDILSVADFNQTQPKVICVETTGRTRDFYNLLCEKHGYTKVVSMGENTIYIDCLFGV